MEDDLEKLKRFNDMVEKLLEKIKSEELTELEIRAERMRLEKEFE